LLLKTAHGLRHEEQVVRDSVMLISYKLFSTKYGTLAAMHGFAGMQEANGKRLSEKRVLLTERCANFTTADMLFSCISYSYTERLSARSLSALIDLMG
jgi:hypothetical protein